MVSIGLNRNSCSYMQLLHEIKMDNRDLFTTIRAIKKRRHQIEAQKMEVSRYSRNTYTILWQWSSNSPQMAYLITDLFVHQLISCTAFQLHWFRFHSPNLLPRSHGTIFPCQRGTVRFGTARFARTVPCRASTVATTVLPGTARLIVVDGGIEESIPVQLEGCKRNQLV